MPMPEYFNRNSWFDLDGVRHRTKERVAGRGNYQTKQRCASCGEMVPVKEISQRQITCTKCKEKL